MKLITLRIDEEEKARLEQLAERGNVTLSRALREGAALYLSEVHGRVHRAGGGETTFHGIRRDQAGRPQNTPSTPTSVERVRLQSLSSALQGQGLAAIRKAWDDGADPTVVCAAVARWLSLVGYIYVNNSDEVGWDWFLRDYCSVPTPEASERLRTEIRAALLRPVELDVGGLIDTLDAGFRRFMDDAEHQDLVRRAVLPTWRVLERSV